MQREVKPMDEAFGAERRGLSGFFSDRTFGAALTAVY